MHAGSAASLAGETSDSADDASEHGLGLDGMSSRENRSECGGEEASDTETEGGTETESDEKDGRSQASATPVASRRRSAETLSSAPPLPDRSSMSASAIDPDEVHVSTDPQAAADFDVDVGAEPPATPRSREYHSAHEPAASTEDEQPAAVCRAHERKASSAPSLGVMRPGVSLRIKRKDGSSRDDDAWDVDAPEPRMQDGTSGNTDSRDDVGHCKMSTEGSGVSELLISPSPSEVSFASIQSGGSMTSRASGASGSGDGSGIKIRPKRQGGMPVKGNAGETGENKQEGRVGGMVREKEEENAKGKARRWSGASAFGQA